MRRHRWTTRAEYVSEHGQVRPSPNIWNWPDVYETENRAQDSSGEIWRILSRSCDWTGRDVVDIGCGDGFHLPVFAGRARSVTGVEPHSPLVHRARQRLAGDCAGSCVEVLSGSAQSLPLPSASADLLHARTAYFFGPGCEPGLAEAERVLRPGGTLVIIDLDVTYPPYGEWMRADLPNYDPKAVESFFERHGFDSIGVETMWRFDERAGLEAALGIEFSPKVARRAAAQVTGRTVPVGYRLRTRHKPRGLFEA